MGVLRLIALTALVFVIGAWVYPNNSLIAWFELRKPTGLSAFSSSKYTQNSIGTLTNGAYYATMQRGGCVYLDGTNDYVEIPDNDIFSFGNGSSDRPFSISLWVYNQNTSGNGCRMVSKAFGAGISNNEYLMGTNPTGNYNFALYSGGFTGTNIIITSTITASSDVNAWVHITATYTGNASTSGMSLYRNGVKLSTNTSTAGVYVAMTNGTMTVDIGRIFGSGTPQYGKGYIQDVRIYNRALNETEVMQLYKETMNRK